MLSILTYSIYVLYCTDGHVSLFAVAAWSILYACSLYGHPFEANH